MLAHLQPEEIEATLDRAADEILSTHGLSEPPFDALELAARLKYTVLWDETLSGRARCIEQRGRYGPTTLVLLRPEPRTERVQWAVAHEIGERHSAKLFAELGLDPSAEASSAREWLANCLAGRLLVPSRSLARLATVLDCDLGLLKEQFSTASHELIARRLLDLRLPLQVSIYDHDRLTFRGAGTGRPDSQPHLAERLCQGAAHRTGLFEGRISAAGRFRCWPIHEPAWQREIVLFQPSDDGEAFD